MKNSILQLKLQNALENIKIGVPIYFLYVHFWYISRLNKV